jgi:hypothetical protein
MAGFRFGRNRSGDVEVSNGVLALVGEHAPSVLAGATLEPGSGDLLVPVAAGRARVATGGLVEHALSQP